MTTIAKKQVKPALTTNPSQNSDAIWDELLAKPESEEFLALMIAEVRQEEAEGTLMEGAWDEI